MMPLLLALVLPAPDPVRPAHAQHPTAVKSLTLSPDLSQLASLSRDGTILIWDIKTRKELRRFASSNLALCLAWLQPSQLVALGAITLDSFDPATGKLLARHKVGQRSDCAALASDGRFAAVANTHFAGKLLDPATGNEIKPFPAPSEWTYAMDASPDSRLLALAGNNPDSDGIAILETSRFTNLREWPTRQKHSVALRFSPDGKLLASAGAPNVVKLWNTADGSQAGSLQLAHTHAASLAFSPDGSMLLVCSGVPPHQLLPHHFDYPLPDDARNVKTTPQLQCFSLKNNEELWHSPTLPAWASAIHFINNTRFVTGHYDGTIQFWDLPMKR